MQYKNLMNVFKTRDFVYEKNNKDKTLMDIAVIAMKEMRKRGMLDDLDISEEINACSIKVNIETNNGIEEYLVMFKNETLITQLKLNLLVEQQLV